MAMPCTKALGLGRLGRMEEYLASHHAVSRCHACRGAMLIHAACYLNKPQVDVKLNTAAQCASTSGDISILAAAWSTNSRICAAGTPINGATPGVCPVRACCRTLGCPRTCCCWRVAGRSLQRLSSSLPPFTCS
jgi:hypothetical protein